MQSAIYRGWLEHRRQAPRGHAFRYRLFMVYLDLAELEQVPPRGGLWPLAARFERRDHLGDPALPLERAVRDLVESRTGRRPAGPIRLLTHLRYFGCCFNPVSFYYCFDAAGREVEHVVAEVNNTPWNERHCYVIGMRARHAKAMHVSPFMPMDVEYDWRFGPPGERLGVRVGLHRGEKLFDATLVLRRSPLTAGRLAAALALQPFMTLKVIAAIHWEALRLWLKRVPFHIHPSRAPGSKRRSAPGSGASSTARSSSAPSATAGAPRAAR